MAKTFGFSSSDVWEMDIDELLFWGQGVTWVAKKIQEAAEANSGR